MINNERNPDESISKVILPEVDSSDNEQEFITPVACSGDENGTANAQAVSNDDHAASLTTPFLE